MIIMKSSQSGNSSKKIRDFIDDLTKALHPDLIEYLRSNFQASMAGRIAGGADLQVKLVIDSNAVIRSLKHYAKTGTQPLLLKLGSNPLFPLYSPTDLETEVSEYIEAKEKKQKNKPKMRKAWNLIKRNISIQKEIHAAAWNKAREVIGKRDPDDIPFVGMYFDLNASGIVTDDRDYDHLEIRRFSIEDLGETVGTFHRGIFSFFILNDFSPALFDFIRQVCLSITKFLSEILVLVLEFLKSLATGMISKVAEWLSRAPPWLIKIAILVVIVGGMVILLHDDTRKKAEDLVQRSKEKIKPILDKILHLVKVIFEKLIEYVEKSASYASVALVSFEELSANIEKLQEEVITLLAKESLASS